MNDTVSNIGEQLAKFQSVKKYRATVVLMHPIWEEEIRRGADCSGDKLAWNYQGVTIRFCSDLSMSVIELY